MRPRAPDRVDQAGGQIPIAHIFLQRARRIGVAMPIEIDHLLASSALPFIFPPKRVNREYFGDGSMRQIAPVAPAIHLGAQRLLVIGAGRMTEPKGESHLLAQQANAYPSIAQIAGHALSNIFLDALAVDVERVRRITTPSAWCRRNCAGKARCAP